MSLIIKGFLKDVFKIVLFGIPAAVWISFLFWGVVGISMPPFVELIRISYIFFLLAGIAIDSFIVFAKVISCVKLSRRFSVSFSDAAEGILIYELHTKAGYENWDSTEFKSELMSARMIEHASKDLSNKSPL